MKNIIGYELSSVSEQGLPTEIGKSRNNQNTSLCLFWKMKNNRGIQPYSVMFFRIIAIFIQIRS